MLITRRQRKDGKYPVKIRICYLRKYKDFKTNHFFTKEEYDKANQPKPSKEFKVIKVKLDALTAKMIQAANAIEDFSFKKFEDVFYNRVKSSSDIFPVFQEYIDKEKNRGSIKNARNYNTAMNSFKKFRASISFYDVTVDFMEKYQKYMLSRSNGRSLTTISMYVRCLQAILNYAKSAGYLKKDFESPFGKGKYQIPASRKRKKALSLDTVESILNYQCTPFSLKDQAKDFWLFSYFCNGINVNDIIKLKFNNIDGKMLRFYRGKTDRTAQSNKILISCNLNKHIQKIITKWGRSSKNQNDYIFKVIEKTDNDEQILKKKDLFSRSLNQYFKKICKALGITGNVTMVFARHSAATIMKQGGAKKQEISEALGHTNPATTDHYLDSFDDTSKIAISNLLINFNSGSQ